MIEEIFLTVNEKMYIRRCARLFLCGASVDSVILAGLRFVREERESTGCGRQHGMAVNP